ncbi:hypothetical protein BKA82DRAFT_2559530 [Pisolithus tinctorius]|nr:hypothetical protein BKA82DRAFT_2559530 [Pisolithus tinctorius]
MAAGPSPFPPTVCRNFISVRCAILLVARSLSLASHENIGTPARRAAGRQLRFRRSFRIAQLQPSCLIVAVCPTYHRIPSTKLLEGIPVHSNLHLEVTCRKTPFALAVSQIYHFQCTRTAGVVCFLNLHPRDMDFDALACMPFLIQLTFCFTRGVPTGHALEHPQKRALNTNLMRWLACGIALKGVEQSADKLESYAACS